MADVETLLDNEYLHRRPERREVLAAMIQLQLLTGMRSGEACALRAESLEARGSVWRYDVREANKNLHRGKPRVVWIGPKGQALLKPFIEAAGTSGRPLFSFPPKLSKWSPGNTIGNSVTITREMYSRFVAEACGRGRRTNTATTTRLPWPAGTKTMKP